MKTTKKNRIIKIYSYCKAITIIITTFFVFLYNYWNQWHRKSESRTLGSSIFSDWPSFFLPTGCRTGFRYKTEKSLLIFDASEVFPVCSTAPSCLPSLGYRCCAVGKQQDLYAYCKLPVVRPFSREAGPFFSVCSLQEPKGDGAGQSLRCIFRHLNKKEIHKVPAMIYSRDPRLNWPDLLTAVIDYN